MKYQINKIIIFGVFILIIAPINNSVFAQAVVSDPVLTGTIITTGEQERKVLNSINDKHNKILTMQAVVGANLDRMRQYEEKIYYYLSNVSDAIKQSYEIKRAAEMTIEIVDSFGQCAQAAAAHPNGLIYTTIVAKKTSKLTQEMIGIYSYLSSIVLSQNTLLNSAERQVIITNVLYKLERINSEIALLKFQIENYTLADLPRVLFPDQYFMFISGKTIADEIINDYSN